MHDLLLRSVGKIILFWPAPAYAHGDDDVTAASFMGPVVAVLVFVTAVGLGKALIRLTTQRP